MPNHAHLLLIPESKKTTVTGITSSLKGPFARKVLARWRELDAPILSNLVDAQGNHHFWQPGGGYDFNLVNPSKIIEKITYTHKNPVKRGLVDTAIAWPWSSARWYEGDDYSGPKIDSVYLGCL